MEKSEHPNFNSLIEIANRLGEVPYANFKKELDEWFSRSLSENGIDLKEIAFSKDISLHDYLHKVVNEIYDLGELSAHVSMKSGKNKRTE